jgi:hypothetical protein
MSGISNSRLFGIYNVEGDPPFYRYKPVKPEEVQFWHDLSEQQSRLSIFDKDDCEVTICKTYHPPRTNMPLKKFGFSIDTVDTDTGEKERVVSEVLSIKFGDETATQTKIEFWNHYDNVRGFLDPKTADVTIPHFDATGKNQKEEIKNFLKINADCVDEMMGETEFQTWAAIRE